MGAPRGGKLKSKIGLDAVAVADAEEER